MLHAIFFSILFGAGLAFPNTQDACAIHTSEAQAADDCAGADCTFHLLLVDGGFDPALCNITGATLSVDVKGEYGSSSEYDGKVEVVLHDAHTSSDSGTIIDSGDIACVNDGTCKSDWDSCLKNYELAPSTFQNLTDSLLLNVTVRTDCTVEETCTLFSSHASLVYDYNCNCAPTMMPSSIIHETPSKAPSSTRPPTPSCQKHNTVAQASYNCNAKGCTFSLPFKYGAEFDPDKCTIDEALLNLEVHGQWGDTYIFDGKPKLYLGYDTNIYNNIEIDGNAVQCQNNVDGHGSVCIPEYMSCLKNYDLLSVPNFTLTPADSILVVLSVSSDCTITSECPFFTASTNLSYTYECDCAPTPFPTGPTTQPTESDRTAEPTLTLVPTPSPTPVCTSVGPLYAPPQGNSGGSVLFTPELSASDLWVNFDEYFHMYQKCTLNSATLFSAIDTNSTSFSDIGTVKIAIAPESSTVAQIVMNEGNVLCTPDVLDAGTPCYAYCNSTDDSEDHHGDDSWPYEFHDTENTPFMSCNKFYELDVTRYFDKNANGVDLTYCADPHTQDMTNLCPALGVYVVRESYQGSENFQAQLDVLMSVTCECELDAQDVFEQQTTINKNAEIGVNVHAIFSTYDPYQTCSLEQATLYTGIINDDGVVPDIDHVSLGLAQKDLGYAKDAFDAKEAECTDEVIAAGTDCYATCGAYSDDSPDHHHDDTWPKVFSQWETVQGTTYQSCNTFYDIDVTNYLMYTNGNLTACANQATASDPDLCPSLGIYFWSDDYQGGTAGDPEFEVMVDAHLDVICSSNSSEGAFKMNRRMECNNAGDCPAKFDFPKSTNGFKTEVPYNKNECTTTQVLLTLQSRAHRDSAPTISFNQATVPAAEIQCGANLPAGGTITHGCPAEDPTAWDDCLVEKIIHLTDESENDLLLTLDATQSNCEGSELYAVVDWTYTCGNVNDNQEYAASNIKPDIIEYEKIYKAPMHGNHRKTSVPVKQKVKMHLRVGN